MIRYCPVARWIPCMNGRPLPHVHLMLGNIADIEPRVIFYIIKQYTLGVIR